MTKLYSMAWHYQFLDKRVLELIWWQACHSTRIQLNVGKHANLNSYYCTGAENSAREGQPHLYLGELVTELT